MMSETWTTQHFLKERNIVMFTTTKVLLLVLLETLVVQTHIVNKNVVHNQKMLTTPRNTFVRRYEHRINVPANFSVGLPNPGPNNKTAAPGKPIGKGNSNVTTDQQSTTTNLSLTTLEKTTNSSRTTEEMTFNSLFATEGMTTTEINVTFPVVNLSSSDIDLARKRILVQAVRFKVAIDNVFVKAQRHMLFMVSKSKATEKMVKQRKEMICLLQDMFPFHKNHTGSILQYSTHQNSLSRAEYMNCYFRNDLLQMNLNDGSPHVNYSEAFQEAEKYIDGTPGWKFLVVFVVDKADEGDKERIIQITKSIKSSGHIIMVFSIGPLHIERLLTQLPSKDFFYNVGDVDTFDNYFEKVKKFKINQC